MAQRRSRNLHTKSSVGTPLEMTHQVEDMFLIFSRSNDPAAKQAALEAIMDGLRNIAAETKRLGKFFEATHHTSLTPTFWSPAKSVQSTPATERLQAREVKRELVLEQQQQQEQTQELAR